MNDINIHGGVRPSAGRKRSELTTLIRVPNSSVLEIKAFLKKAKSDPEIDHIRQVDPVTQMAIPLATERVQAGFPSPAQDHVDKTLDLNEHLIKNPAATFIVRVNSLSLINIGIDIGDELIVDRSLEAKHWDIVIALVDNEFTVKRLMCEDNGGCWLKAENPDYDDIHFSEGQEFIIWGVVTRVLKSFR